MRRFIKKYKISINESIKVINNNYIEWDILKNKYDLNFLLKIGFK